MFGRMGNAARYTAHDYFIDMPVDEYISRFRDADRFMGYCKECANYGRLWTCPPFRHDRSDELRLYDNVLLIATKISPGSEDIPLSESLNFIKPERERIERRLLEMEDLYGGRSFAFAGSCL